jgi:amino acid transporter
MGCFNWLTCVRARSFYRYLINVSSVCTFIVWASIAWIHIRFRRAMKAQGRSISELPFKSCWYPWTTYFGLFANIFLGLIQGWSVFSPFDAGAFVAAYIAIPVFFIIWIGFKLVFKCPSHQLVDIDLDVGRRKDMDHEMYETSSSTDEIQPNKSRSKSKKWWKSI